MEKTPVSQYKIRFSDCDPFGHLNNARYLDYFLNAREDHLKEVYQLDLSDYYKQGISWLVGSHEIQYLKPAHYSETVAIQTSLIRAEADLLLVEMAMADPNSKQLKALCWTRFIPVNLKTGRRENHPEAFMSFAKSIENRITETQLSESLAVKMAALKREAKV